MAWLDSVKAKKEQREKDEVPERLKGKSPTEVLKMIEDAEAFKTKFETSEAARAEDSRKLNDFSTQLNDVRSQLAAAEANRNKAPEKQEELANFVEEPDRAFSQRVSPVVNATLYNSALTARMLAQQMLDNNDLTAGGKAMDGRLFRAWTSEIDGESKKYQTAQLTTPQAWVGIFYYLKGLHSEELSNPEIRKKKYNFIEPSASQSEPPDKKPKSATEELTDQEKHVADKMGVSYENYLKRKKQMTFING